MTDEQKSAALGFNHLMINDVYKDGVARLEKDKIREKRTNDQRRMAKKKELKEAIEELQFVRNDMPVFKEKDSEVTPTWQLTMRNICPEFYHES